MNVHTQLTHLDEARIKDSGIYGPVRSRQRSLHIGDVTLIVGGGVTPAAMRAEAATLSKISAAANEIASWLLSAADDADDFVADVRRDKDAGNDDAEPVLEDDEVPA